MKKKDIIIFSNIEFDFLYQRHQTLASELSKYYKSILFIESAAKRNPKFSDLIRIKDRFKKLLFKRDARVHNGLKIISPVLLPSTYKIFRRINELVFIPLLYNKIRYFSSYAIDDSIAIFYAPTHTNLIFTEYYKDCVKIYDCVSNFSAIEGMPADTYLIEEKLINSVELVSVDCQFLFDKLKKMKESVKIIPPVVDFHLFSNSMSPLSLSIKCLLYYGYADTKKIDYNLLNRLVDIGYKITIVGVVEESQLLDDRICIKKTVKPQELINYIEHADALLLPYNINDYTNGIIPAKIFECFASGKYVVSTGFYNLKPYMDIVINVTELFDDDFNKKLDLVIQNKKREERIKIAKNRDTTNFGKEILKFIDSVQTKSN